MSSQLRRASSLFAVSVLGVALLQPFGGAAAAKSNRGGRLQGTWRVQVNPVNCQTGAPLAPFAVRLSFARGGTVTEVTSSQAFLPGQRTPGLGVWNHIDDNAYRAVIEGFILFDSPAPGVFKRGVQRLMWDIEIDGDQMTIASTSQFFDANGNPVFVACASATGTRFEDAQDED